MTWPLAVVLNLETRPDRLATFTSRLQEAGISFHRIHGCTPDQVAELGFGVAPDLRGRDLPLGGIGCTLSHLTAYEYLLASAHELLMVFEDDVFLVANFRARVETLLEQRKPETDVVQIGWLRYTPLLPRQQPRLRRTANTAPKLDKLVGATYAYGAHCYVVTRRFAAAALKYMNPMFANIDIMIENMRDDKDFIVERCIPPLAVQSTSPSDIGVRTFGMEAAPTW